jgi:type II secretory pathway component PulL
MLYVAQCTRFGNRGYKAGIAEATAIKAKDDAQTRTSQAQGWLKEAREALGTGCEALEQVNLAHPLEKMPAPYLKPGANAGAELERSAATAHRSAEATAQAVGALQQHRKEQASFRLTAAFATVVFFLLCLFLSVWLIFRPGG